MRIDRRYARGVTDSTLVTPPRIDRYDAQTLTIEQAEKLLEVRFGEGKCQNLSIVTEFSANQLLAQIVAKRSL